MYLESISLFQNCFSRLHGLSTHLENSRSFTRNGETFDVGGSQKETTGGAIGFCGTSINLFSSASYHNDASRCVSSHHLFKGSNCFDPGYVEKDNIKSYTTALPAQLFNFFLDWIILYCPGVWRFELDIGSPHTTRIRAAWIHTTHNTQFQFVLNYFTQCINFTLADSHNMKICLDIFLNLLIKGFYIVFFEDPGFLEQKKL